MDEMYPWLLEMLDSFARRIDAGRMPHGLLLAGRPGIGKRAFARELAGLLLCEQRTTGGHRCGSCPGCQLFAAGTHPDFIAVNQLVDEKSGVEAASIKVDQVRRLAADLALSSHRNGYKIAVIAPADSMNINAANSLLKTLEEPTDNTVLVLVCEHPGRLPATIRSRCQQLVMTLPAPAVASEWLAARLTGPDMGAYLKLAGGAPLEALRLAEREEIPRRRQLFQDLVELFARRSDPLPLAERWGKDEQNRLLHWVRDWVMDLIRICLGGRMDQIQNVDLVDGLVRLAPQLDPKALFGLLEQINRVLRVADGVLNRQLAVEEVLLYWSGLGLKQGK